VTAFPEKSQAAGKIGEEKGEIPLNLLVFPPPTKIRAPHRPRARHTSSATWRTPEDAKEVFRSRSDLGALGVLAVKISPVLAVIFLGGQR